MHDTRVLHTLNAARVCAEYCVVVSHVTPVGNGLINNDKLASALMSFFFVLSGFMATYTNMDTDFGVNGARWDYIRKRLQKTYTTYLIFFLLDTPGNIMTNLEHAGRCGFYWVALLSQPLLLQAWLGSFFVGNANGIGWYLCTLLWLWFLFPFLPVRKWFSHLPAIKLTCLYCLSVLCFVAFSNVHYTTTRAFPLLRLAEFLMGSCVAFTLDRPISGWLVLPAFLGVVAYSTATYTLPDLWAFEDTTQTCQFWPVVKRSINPTTVLSLFSLVWCLLLQWLAASELKGSTSAVIKALQWDFFKSLSGFSLQLYLSHVVFSTGIRHILGQLGISNWLGVDSLLLSVYFLAYLYSLGERAGMRWCGAYLTPSQKIPQNSTQAAGV